MNSGKTIFAQLMDFVPAYEFRKCVNRYSGNRKVISFSCWDQYLCMAFAQLTYRESLGDIEACLRATRSRLYHLGIRGKVSRNTLANANQNRDWPYVCRFRSNPHCESQNTLRHGLLRYRTGTSGICPGWFVVNSPDKLPKIEEDKQFIFDQGHEVGNYAKKLFPEGVEVPHDSNFY